MKATSGATLRPIQTIPNACTSKPPMMSRRSPNRLTSRPAIGATMKSGAVHGQQPQAAGERSVALAGL
jgi:hypothetical protein